MSSNEKDLEVFLDRYDFPYAPTEIAKEPARPRDSARLLVHDRASGETQYDTFLHLDRYLPSGAVLVFNETRVIPARFAARKEATGGAVTLLYTRTRDDRFYALSEKRLTPGTVLISFGDMRFIVRDKAGSEYECEPLFDISELLPLLERFGKVPLPPYMKDTALTEADRKRAYQTVFARARGSVAAPTASLHFTDRLMKKLERAGFGLAFVTLHVGLGTFAPLTEEHLAEGRLHREEYSIDADTAAQLEAAKKEGRPIIAVGTTVVRTLESAADAQGRLERLTGGTELFIQEGYRFRFVDSIITNFHVPRSSLLVLVSAFAGRETVLSLYAEAREKGFKLFSFGDGMLLK